MVTISNLTALTTPDDADRLVVDDVSAAQTKYVTAETLKYPPMRIRTVTGSSYTVDEDYEVVLVNATSAFTVNLPAAPTTGFHVYIKRVNATYTVTIDANSTDLIDGSETLALASRYDSAHLMWDGTYWWIL